MLCSFSNATYQHHCPSRPQVSPTPFTFPCSHAPPDIYFWPHYIPTRLGRASSSAGWRAESRRPSSTSPGDNPTSCSRMLLFPRSLRTLRIPKSRRFHTCSRRVMPEPVIGVRSDSHGSTATITQDPPQALPELCARVHQKLEAFLRKKPGSERVRGVQDQSRLSLRILEEALERYRYVHTVIGKAA